jgi:hypothetical protein
MKLLLLFFIFALSIEIPLPVGPISNSSIYGPLNYTIKNMRLNFIDPSIGLTNITWYRVLNKLPDDFPSNLMSQLVYHLKRTSVNSNNQGEILIVTGDSKCGEKEVRLVTLTDGNLNHLIPSLVFEDPNPRRCCSKILDSHYGTKSCKGTSERTIYLITTIPTYIDWSFAEGSLDPPTDLRKLTQLSENIDLVISGTQDSDSIPGEILARNNKVDLWIDDVLSQKCGIQYESWRLFNRMPFHQSSKDIISLLNDLSSEMLNIALIMDSCTANNFLKSIGYSNEIHDGSILEINLQNSTGIPHWYFHSILERFGSSECHKDCSSTLTLNEKLIDGSEIDHTITQVELFKLTPTEQSKYFRLQYEREIWTKLYWEYRYIFRDNLLQEKHGIKYWGRFPIKEFDTNELIGMRWIDSFKNIWIKSSYH